MLKRIRTIMREQGGKSMFKKILMTGLLVATVLSLSACGKDSGIGDGTGTVESSSAESQTTEEETEGETEDASQSTKESEEAEEEEAEDNSASYIFAETPIATYEVTGLKVGPDEVFYDEPINDEFTEEDFKIPFVELGDNTFILYCLPGGDTGDEDGEGDGLGISRLATIQSPSGSSPWEAHTYTTGDYSDEYVPEGYSRFSRQEYEGDFTEGTNGGRFNSWVDPWLNYIRFSEIFHPDAPQADTIYAIEIVTISEADKDQETILSAVKAALEEGGATLNEIPVEDALTRSNIVVSGSGAN